MATCWRCSTEVAPIDDERWVFFNCPGCGKQWRRPKLSSSGGVGAILLVLAIVAGLLWVGALALNEFSRALFNFQFALYRAGPWIMGALALFFFWLAFRKK